MLDCTVQLLVQWFLLSVSANCSFTAMKRANPSTAFVLTLVIRLLWGERTPVTHAKMVTLNASTNLRREVQSQRWVELSWPFELWPCSWQVRAVVSNSLSHLFKHFINDHVSCPGRR